MFNETEALNEYDFSFFYGLLCSILSTVSVIVLFVTWCMLPQWRTLQNYISINQIITGTLHLNFTFYLYDLPESMINWHVIMIVFMLQEILIYLIQSWSLCASIIAYTKLVVLYTGNITGEKKKATLFAYISALMRIMIARCIIPTLFDISKIDIGMFQLHDLNDWIMLTLILWIYVRIIISVFSCFRSKMSARNFRHVISVVGVGIICDSILFFYWPTMTFNLRSLPYFIANVFFRLRLVIQTLFVMCNRQTRQYWSIYFRKKRRLRNNFV